MLARGVPVGVLIIWDWPRAFVEEKKKEKKKKEEGRREKAA